MTVAIRDLSVLHCANGFTMWHYSCATLGEVAAAGYFDDARGILADGDMMLVSASNGGAQFYIRAKEGSVRLAWMSGTGKAGR